jgi:hypothetical protein
VTPPPAWPYLLILAVLFVIGLAQRLRRGR